MRSQGKGFSNPRNSGAWNRPRKDAPDIFSQVKQYIMDGNAEVVPLYQLEKEGKLFGQGEAGKAGREFLTQQLVKGGQMLGDLWETAWETAEEDHYLGNQLRTRAHPPL